MGKFDAVLLPDVKALEALISRLPAQHSYQKFLEVELHRTSAGKRGEEKLLKKLAEFNWKENHLILPDVSLSRGDVKIQMDSLLLTHSQAIIIESKNIHGKISRTSCVPDISMSYNTNTKIDYFTCAVSELYAVWGNNLWYRKSLA